MYHQFYHLKQDPFADTPDPEFLFLSPTHKAALRAMMDGIEARREWVVLFGGAGLGKTTLLRAYLDRMQQQCTTVYVFYSKISFRELLEVMAQELGLTYTMDDTMGRLNQLQRALCTGRGHGQQVVVVIDEAQNMPVQTLAALPVLATLVTPAQQPLVQLVFAGLPEFRRTLNQRDLRPLKKQLAVWATLSPLTPKESLTYLRHRLAKVLTPEDAIFTTGALRRIIRYARGNPRVLNALCANMLITGVVRQERRISADIAQEVIAEFGTRRFSRLLRRGVAYAAGVLLVSGLVWGVQSGRLQLAMKSPLELAHLFWPLSEAFRKYQTEQVAQAIATSTQRQPSLPAPPLVADLREPIPLVPPLPTQVGLPVPEDLIPQKSTTTVQRAGASAPAPHSVAAVPSTPPAPPAGPVRKARPLSQDKAPGKTTPETAATASSQSPVETPPVAPGRAKRLPVATPAPREPQTVALAPLPRTQTAPLPTTAGALPKHNPASTVPMERPPQEANGEGSKAGSEAPAQSAPVAVAIPHLAGPGGAGLEVPPRFAIDAGGHEAVIRELLFTADGRELVSVSDDKTIRVWSVAPDGRQAALARTIRGPLGKGREGMLAAATLSPADATGQHRWLAVGGWLPGSAQERYAVRLHDYASGEVVGLLRGHSDAVLALAFSPTGRWLASAGKDATVRLWDLTAFQGKQLTREPLVLTAHTDHIYDLAWSATGERLATASHDRTVGLWDTRPLAQDRVTLMTRLQGHEDQVQTVAFHPDSQVLVTGGKDQTVRQWRAFDGEPMGVLARAKHKISALAFSPDGRLLLAGNYSPPRPDRLTLFAYPTGNVQQVFTGHQNLVVATAFHPGGQWVASGGGEQKEILLWNTHNGEVLSRLEGRGRTIYAVGFSRDGRYLSWGHTVNYTSPNSQGALEHRFDVSQLTRLPGGLSDTTVVRAQERVGEMSLALESGGPYGHSYRLHVQHNGRRLSSIERGQADGYRHSAYTLTADGQGILSGGLNGVLKLYALDGTLHAELLGHTGEIKAVAVSADGRWALSGANDQTLRLWSLAGLSAAGGTTIEPAITIFPAADGEWVAWTPDGFFAASAHGAQLIGHSVNQGLDKLVTYVSADQLRERFYRPEVVQARLHGDLPALPLKTAQRDAGH